MNDDYYQNQNKSKVNRGISTADFLNKLSMQEKTNISRHDENSQLAKIMAKNIKLLRSQIMDFQLLEKTEEEVKKSEIPKNTNVILFGPAGSGKSSLIRTFYISLHNKFSLDNRLKGDLVIKKLSANEGTTNFTHIELKTGEHNVMKTGKQVFEYNKTGIRVFDTRGQILLDDYEKEHLNLMLEGKVKNKSKIENRNYRYAYMLYEFWKKDAELFPEDILNEESSLSNQPHSVIFVFDGSLEEVPNGDEEVEFYRNVLQRCRSRKYFYPQIVLTRVDKLEEQVNKMILRNQVLPKNKERKIKELQDQKIENIVLKLSVPRNSVHFIENYHEKHSRNKTEIDYYALKLLKETINQSEKYVESTIPKEGCCLI